MLKQHWEYISIILDTLAYFLVTIDLYGKERLKKLQNIILTANAVNIKKTKLYQKSTFVITFLFLGILGALVRIELNYSIHNFGEIFSKNDFQQNLIFIFKIIALNIAFGLYITNEAFCIDFFRDKVLGSILNFILYLSFLFPIEGVMLTIGTALFIISKVIAFSIV